MHIRVCDAYCFLCFAGQNFHALIEQDRGLKMLYVTTVTEDLWLDIF